MTRNTYLDLQESYFPLEFSAKQLKEWRERYDFSDVDTLVGTGMSGSILVPQMAKAWKKKFCIVRKPSEFTGPFGVKTHGDRCVVGTLGHAWMFVDDGISSGATYKRVKLAIKEVSVGIRSNYQRSLDPLERDPRWNTTFVGAFLYGFRSPQYAEFITADQMRSRWGV